MPKRQDALIPLTHDHHHALAYARRLMEAAEADPGARHEEAMSFLSFYADDILLHFHEEEEVLFPPFLRQTGDAPPALTQVLVEHIRIHGLVAELRAALSDGDLPPDLLTTLGQTLRAHVRLEEKVLFPLIETTVTAPDLDALEFAPRARE